MAGDVIATGANSSARLQLRSGVWATVSPESQILAPPGAQGRDVELRNGTVVVGRQSPDPVRISFPGAWVVVKGSAAAGPLCAVESSGSSSKVTLVAGVAEIHGAGDPVLLHAGQWARLDMGIAPMPQAAGSGGSGAPEAGKVTREVPQGTVQRQGKELPLSMNDAVDWNDTVHTQNKGRLQITLTDGSVLSVGSRSEMKIVKHDAEAQQTDIELVVGTVKADVQKVTKSGGHFEIRTKTAVIGVVGTTLMVTSNSKGTMVCNTTQNSNGEAEVTVSDTNGTQTQKLKSGFCAFFPISGAATALTASASASQIAGMTTATIVATTVAAGAAGSVTLSTGVIVGFIAVGAAVGTTLGVYGAAGGFSNSSPVSVP
jgi:ferric-dicitrate binding protein FerR (iron transport regulator)